MVNGQWGNGRLNRQLQIINVGNGRLNHQFYVGGEARMRVE
jgi:hypothetical protein